MNDMLKIIPYGKVFACFLNNDLESSLLLVDELWDEKLASIGPAGFMATIPAREVLAFCDATCSGGIEELRNVARRGEGADHAITPILFRRSNGCWLRNADS
jgi:hypothetical protein